MERVSIKAAAVVGGIFVAIIHSSVCAWAGTVLAPPSKPLTVGENGEIYPESRFGQPPARVGMEMEADYGPASKNDDDWDDPHAAGTRRVNRNPAGLVVGTDPMAPDPQIANGTVHRALTDSSGDPSLGTPKELETLALKRKGVQEVALIAGDLGFFPKTVFVSKDVPVRMYVTGASRNTLCIMMDSFQVRKQVRSQKIEEITFTPGTPGKYRFYCPVNGMEGTLIVRELSGAAPILGQN